MKKLDKLMEKKSDGKELDPTYKSAKMSTLKALRDEMVGMMKDDLHPGMKKVEVAANDKAGLAHGLDKAKDIISGGEDTVGEDDHSDIMSGMGKEGILGQDGDDEDSESGAELIEDQIEHEGSEGELTDEEINQLEMLLEKMKKSKKM